MKRRHPESRSSTRSSRARSPLPAWLAAAPASAGGLSLYEIGTEDVGLASAGYTARAQDASTVFTNPAGMTRLDGTQVTMGAQALYGDLGFSIGQGTSPGLGNGDGGNPIGWFPGRRLLLLVQRVARPQARVRSNRQFRPVDELRLRLGRPVLHPGGYAGGVVIRAVRCLSLGPAVVGGREPQRDVRQDPGPSRREQPRRLRRQCWCSTTTSGAWGERSAFCTSRAPAPGSGWRGTRRSSSTSRPRPSSRGCRMHSRP